MIALRYSDHYGFTAMPFQLTPDCRFFFGSQGHRGAMTHLLCGLAQEEGFIIVTGDVGAGKTTLIEYLRARLGGSPFVVGTVSACSVDGLDMLRLVASAFGLPVDDASKVLLIAALETRLRQVRAAGSRCLLVVDEVQGLSVAALEELRLLSNIVEGGRPLLQVVLAGQPQFRATLGSPELDQLRQRVIACYHLGPLTEAETHAYIRHRLAMVGWSGKPAWGEDASSEVHRHAQGVPRRINRLCARVLMHGALDDLAAIGLPVVEDVARELEQDLGDRTAARGPALVQMPLPAAASAAAARDGTTLRKFSLAQPRPRS